MKTCKYCGDEIPSTKRKDAIFCSIKCQKQQERIRRLKMREEKREIPTKICPVCEEKFKPHKNSYKTQLYCSYDCKMTAYYKRRSEKGRTESNRRYIENNREFVNEIQRKYRQKSMYSGNKLKVLKRDGHKCTECGYTKNLHIHHKDFSGQTDNPNDSIDNLVTLCIKCHSKLHFNHYVSVHKPHNYKDIQKEEIEHALQVNETIQETADYLGITRKTLLLKRKQYGLPMRK